MEPLIWIMEKQVCALKRRLGELKRGSCASYRVGDQLVILGKGISIELRRYAVKDMHYLGVLWQNIRLMGRCHPKDKQSCLRGNNLPCGRRIPAALHKLYYLFISADATSLHISRDSISFISGCPVNEFKPIIQQRGSFMVRNYRRPITQQVQLLMTSSGVKRRQTGSLRIPPQAQTRPNEGNRVRLSLVPQTWERPK